MTTPTGKVAFTASLPVDVLMKSAPAIIATWLARATFASVARSPVPRITFMCAAPHAARKARTSSYTASQSPASAWARVMTTSISSAPAATEALISSIRWGRGLSPAGNPVDTAATGMPEPWSAWTATGTKAWYRHTAPTLIPKSVAPSASSRSRRTGSFALAHSRSTLVGVSSPCRVVRSMHVIARSSQAACHSRLTVRRVGMVAARRSTALRFTRNARTRSRSRGVPGLRSSRGWTRSARSTEPAGTVAAGAASADLDRVSRPVRQLDRLDAVVLARVAPAGQYERRVDGAGSGLCERHFLPAHRRCVWVRRDALHAALLRAARHADSIVARPDLRRLAPHGCVHRAVRPRAAVLSARPGCPVVARRAAVGAVSRRGIVPAALAPGEG